MSQKRIILSDSSLNRYGYRVLTSGMLLEAFKKNPVMLYMHFRDEGSPIWGETKAIGKIYSLKAMYFLPFLFSTRLINYLKTLPQNTKQGLTTPQVSVSASLLHQPTKTFWYLVRLAKQLQSQS
jgi:hypothetical protein